VLTRVSWLALLSATAVEAKEAAARTGSEAVAMAVEAMEAVPWGPEAKEASRACSCFAAALWMLTAVEARLIILTSAVS